MFKLATLSIYLPIMSNPCWGPRQTLRQMYVGYIRRDHLMVDGVV